MTALTDALGRPGYEPATQADAFAALRPADAVGQGQYRPERHEVDGVAAFICDIWTGGYLHEFSDKVRLDVRKAATGVLVDSSGDFEAIREAHADIRADKFEREACRMCHSPYGVARHLYTKVSLMKAQAHDKEKNVGETWIRKLRELEIGE